MNKKVFLLVLITSVFISACGGSKKMNAASTGNKNVKNDEISSADFPFIDKFHQALRFKHQGRFDDAIKLLEECRTIKPNNDAVHFALYDLYLMKKQFPQAFESIKKAASIDNNNSWYKQELAFQNIEKGNFSEAAKQLKAMLDKDPSRLDLLFAYVEAQANAKNLNEAIIGLNKIQDQVGPNPEISIQKYVLYKGYKQEDKAVQELENALKIFPKDVQLTAMLVDYYFEKKLPEKAFDYLKKLSEIDPDNGNAHMALAQFYEQKGQYDNMFKELNLAFQSEDIEEGSKIKIIEGLINSFSTKTNELITLNEYLINLYPSSSKPLKIEGDLYLKQTEYSKAIKSYKQAVAIDSSLFSAWKNLLDCEYRIQDDENLFLDSKKAIELFPTATKFYLYNGFSAINLRKFKEAIEILNLGLELVGSDKVIRTEFLSQLGDVYFATRDYKNAQKSYDEVLTYFPENLLYLSNYTYQLALSKANLEKAESLADKLIALSPKDGKYIDTYGWVQFQKGNYKNAQEAFEKAFELKPNDPMIVEHLGDVNYKLGNTNQAIIYWNKSKDLNSKNLNLNKKIERKEYYEPIF